MFSWMATGIAWMYDLTHNYGLAIGLLTLAIMVVLTPLTLKGTRSMIAMQRLQPEMKKIQNRYKDDRQKLNEEMMAFYKENNINPVGGCLPLVLQMPVFWVLYRVLYGLTNPAPYAQDMGRQFALATKNRAAAFPHFGSFHPSYLHKNSNLYHRLSESHSMKSFGFDLATSASHILETNVAKSPPYLILIALIGLTAWYSQKQIMSRTPQMAQSNPQQQMMMKIMPYFLPIISITLPAGVTVYFLVSNAYRILQQAFITRTMYVDEHGNPVLTPPVDDVPTDDAPKGLFSQFKAAANESTTRIKDNKESRGNAAPAKGSGRENLAKRTGGKPKTPPGGSAVAKGNTAKGSTAKAPGTRATTNGGSKANGSKPGAKTSGSSKPNQPTGGANANGGGRKPQSTRPTKATTGNRPAPKAPASGSSAPNGGKGAGPSPTPKTDAVPQDTTAPASRGPVVRPSRSAPPTPNRPDNGKGGN